MQKRKRVTKDSVDERPINTLNTPFLVIVESPSKCDKIETYLGFQYKCISSKGHIRELTKVGTKKDNYKPTFNEIKEKCSHIAWMRSIIVQFPSTNVFLATDDDREGEGIAWHICEVFHLPIQTTPRIIFHEITKSAVQNAVQKPIKLRMEIVIAQQTRQILDRLIGFKVSPFLTKLLVHESKEFLSAGRCQTPALRLIYENEIANEKKKKDELLYNVSGTFFPHPSTVKMHLNRKFRVECSEVSQMQDFLEKTKTFSHLLSIEEAKVKTKSPPKPFNTSRLLQTASSELHISPKQTMSFCQILYQDGLITYMRTDSTKYADVFLSKMSLFLKNTYGSDAYIGTLNNLTNENKADPHEAIRVTDLTCLQPSKGDGKLKALYHLIRLRTIESCMSQYKAMHSMVMLTAPLDCTYTYDLEIGEFLGWKRASTDVTEFQKQQQKQLGFRTYCERYIGTPVKYDKIICTISTVESQRHYTEASLIQKLEVVGIGRPSTFSSIVETLKERKYVEKQDTTGETIDCTEYILNRLEGNNVIATTVQKTFGAEKNKLIIQPLGRQVIVQMTEHFETLFSYDYTASMELGLDNIIQNGGDGHDMCLQCEEEINLCKSPLEKKMRQTYRINDECGLVFGKNGAYIKFVDETKNSISLKPNLELDFTRLENQEYSLDELSEVLETNLGDYQGFTLTVRKGKFGVYASWGENTQSLRRLGKPVCEITREDALSLIEPLKNDTITAVRTGSGIVRVLNDKMSVRMGKFGAYVYYQKGNGEKPAFISLKKFKNGYLTCDKTDIMDWLRTVHNIEI